MRRVGLFGGTFDPFHRGHLAMIEAALASSAIDEIWILPIAIPPLKARLPLLAGFRLALIEASLPHDPRLRLCDYELLRAGKNSYTFDTVTGLITEHPDCQFVWIAGSDILFSLDRWHRAGEVMQTIRFLVADRGGEDKRRAREAAQDLRARFGARIEAFSMPEIEISSTQLRAKLARGEQTDGLVAGAEELARRYALYQYDDAWQLLDHAFYKKLAELERQLSRELSEARLLHSLSVLAYGLELARIHDVDLEAVALACLLHDYAKEWPDDQQAAWAEKDYDGSRIDGWNLHGFAAAAYLRTEGILNDPQILRAIAQHTLGGPDGDELCRLVFLADKLEPSRPYAERDELAELAKIDLDLAYRETFLASLKHFTRLGYPYPRETEEIMAEWLDSGAYE